jgi:hypothetical protein
MVSGARYEVLHPDFIFIAPRGTFVMIVDAHDRPHNLSSLLIERASPISTRRKRKTSRNS